MKRSADRIRTTHAGRLPVAPGLENLPVRLFAEEGFVQILFFESDELCDTSYSDRQGKYQDQAGLTLAKV